MGKLKLENYTWFMAGYVWFPILHLQSALKNTFFSRNRHYYCVLESCWWNCWSFSVLTKGIVLRLVCSLKHSVHLFRAVLFQGFLISVSFLPWTYWCISVVCRLGYLCGCYLLYGLHRWISYCLYSVPLTFICLPLYPIYTPWKLQTIS